ncbi:hypothetical protein DL96DRAFT_1711380 [Flagelloscypha sp. PMI_526]|nr:hypothetical protein DL96DRAFT_1711380 [Flagelloscypha sp. PMI_526]
MTSVGFPYFLDLPNELQGVIWYFVAIGASTHQQASLVLVSKSSRPWIESILYRDIHIIKRYSTKSLSLLSGITQSPGLFSNTIANLWLVVYDREGATLALSLDSP